MLCLGVLTSLIPMATRGAKGRAGLKPTEPKGATGLGRTLGNFLAAAAEAGVAAIVLLLLYCSLTLPRAPLGQILGVGLAVAWWGSGLGQALKACSAFQGVHLRMGTLLLVLAVGGALSGVYPPLWALDGPLRLLSGETVLQIFFG